MTGPVLDRCGVPGPDDQHCLLPAGGPCVQHQDHRESWSEDLPRGWRWRHPHLCQDADCMARSAPATIEALAEQVKVLSGRNERMASLIGAHTTLANKAINQPALETISRVEALLAHWDGPYWCGNPDMREALRAALNGGTT